MATADDSLGSFYLLAFLRDEASATAVRSAMQAEGRQFEVHSGNVVQATKYLSDNPSPEILIVEAPSAEEAPKLLDKLADVVNPSTRVIVTGKIDTYRFYDWLIEIGIADYLLQPFNEVRLKAVLHKTVHTAAPAATAHEKKLIAVIGTRGGVGTTTVAIHLAALFARELGIPTALLDPDVHFGAVALGFDLEPSRGLTDALEKPDRIDALFLERVMVKPFANLAILSAEEALQEQVAVQPTAAEALIGELQQQCPVVVVDLPRQINAFTHYVLAQADHTVLVAEPSLLNLRDALRIKDYLVDTLKRPAPFAVINRKGLAGKSELPKADFSKHYGAQPVAELPYIVEAFDAMSRGEILLGNVKGKPVVDPLRTLVGKFTGKKVGASKKAAKKKESTDFLHKLLKAGK